MIQVVRKYIHNPFSC